jgi:hypothetical protein
MSIRRRWVGIDTFFAIIIIHMFFNLFSNKAKMIILHA